MGSRAVVLGLLLAGCSFRPGGEGSEDAAGDDDADVVADAADGDAVDTDAATTDAAATDAAAFDARVIDARVIDAMVPIDARIDAAGPTLVETLVIPGIGTVVTSQQTLQLGVQYTLRVSGEIVIAANGAHGDAEYWDYDVGGIPQDLAGVDVGLGINDVPVDTSKSPSWGTYTATHVYQVMFTGLGSTITANYHDGNPANNSGNVVLQIYGP